MKVFWGIVIALVSIALLIGAFSVSLAEGNMRQSTPSRPPTITLTHQPSSSLMDSPTPTPPIWTPTLPPTITLTWQSSPSLMDSPTFLPPTWTPTLPPPPTNCPPPPGWLPYTVQPGDTLDGLAFRYKKTSAEISQANCLGSAGLLPDQVVYLPPVPTQTPVPCGAPHNWIIYIVQPGDTLYHLGQAYGIPYTDIQRANCLTSINLRIGQQLYVPPWATRTPSPTLILPSDTPFGTWTDIPTETAIIETSTPTEPDTDTPIPTDTLPTP